MRKVTVKCLLIIFLLMASLLPGGIVTLGAEKDIVLELDGKVIKPNGQAPIMKNNRVMVPVRFIGESLGSKVSYDDKNKMITLTKGQKNVILYIGKNYAFIDNKKIQLDAAPEIVNNTAMVPIRFISDAFDAKVGWDQKKYQVTINSNEFRTSQLLTLSALSYSVVDGFYGGTQLKDMDFKNSKHLKNFREKFDDLKKDNKDFAKYTLDQFLTRYSMYDWKIYTFLDNKTGKAAYEAGMFGVVFFNMKTNDYVVAFRGTSPSYKDIKEDIISVVGGGYSKQLPYARKLIEKIPNYDKEKSNITITGHSLGGFITQNMSAEYDIKGVTFNSPGFNKNDKAYLLFKGKKDFLVKNYLIKLDFISEHGEDRKIGEVIKYNRDHGLFDLVGNFHAVISFYEFLDFSKTK